MIISIILILFVSGVFIWCIFQEKSVSAMIGDIASFLFGCFLIAAIQATYKNSHKEKDYIYINRYDLGIKTIVKDSIEDTIFITDKYMNKEEFIKQYIEK